MKDEMKSAHTLLEFFDAKYGERGTVKRERFERKASTFIVAELVKEARLKAKMTQEELAKRSGTKKSYISRIEGGKSDIQFSTLLRILEEGLGKRVSLKVD